MRESTTLNSDRRLCVCLRETMNILWYKLLSLTPADQDMNVYLRFTESTQPTQHNADGRRMTLIRIIVKNCGHWRQHVFTMLMWSTNNIIPF